MYHTRTSNRPTKEPRDPSSISRASPFHAMRFDNRRRAALPLSFKHLIALLSRSTRCTIAAIPSVYRLPLHRRLPRRCRSQARPPSILRVNATHAASPTSRISEMHLSIAVVNGRFSRLGMARASFWRMTRTMSSFRSTALIMVMMMLLLLHNSFLQAMQQARIKHWVSTNNRLHNSSHHSSHHRNNLLKHRHTSKHRIELLHRSWVLIHSSDAISSSSEQPNETRHGSRDRSSIRRRTHSIFYTRPTSCAARRSRPTC